MQSHFTHLCKRYMQAGTISYTLANKHTNTYIKTNTKSSTLTVRHNNKSTNVGALCTHVHPDKRSESSLSKELKEH